MPGRKVYSLEKQSRNRYPRNGTDMDPTSFILLVVVILAVVAGVAIGARLRRR